MANTMSIVTEYNPKVQEYLDKIPQKLEKRIGGKAARGAGTIIARKARKAAPDSRKTGTREKWSQKIKASRSKNDQMKKQIRVRTLKKRQLKQAGIRRGFGAVVVSVRGHLQEFGYEQRQWGRPAVTASPEPWFRPVVDSQRGAANQKMVNVIQVELEREAKKQRGGLKKQ